MRMQWSVSQNKIVANLRDRLSQIESQMDSACQISGRKRNEICLIAVTKTVPISRIQEAYDLGLRHFGESRLQEALPKIQALPSDIHWHFIGKLQSNKLRRASESFEVIHSIESQSQINEISKLNSPINVLIEVNIGQEAEKSGVFEQELTKFHSSVIECKQANFRGLMAIGPNLESAELMRPYFRKLQELNQQVGGKWLSMGMSSDFEVAIQEGATHIRIGSALFGER